MLLRFLPYDSKSVFRKFSGEIFVCIKSKTGYRNLEGNKRQVPKWKKKTKNKKKSVWLLDMWRQEEGTEKLCDDESKRKK